MITVADDGVHGVSRRYAVHFAHDAEVEGTVLCCIVPGICCHEVVEGRDDHSSTLFVEHHDGSRL